MGQIGSISRTTLVAAGSNCRLPAPFQLAGKPIRKRADSRCSGLDRQRPMTATSQRVGRSAHAKVRDGQQVVQPDPSFAEVDQQSQRTPLQQGQFEMAEPPFEDEAVDVPAPDLCLALRMEISKNWNFQDVHKHFTQYNFSFNLTPAMGRIL